ncbi:MAG TPA: hypothetical protein VJ350_08090 [Methanoregula sp.]|nr:hypothetical protein [Methanoregula sp.]
MSRFRQHTLQLSCSGACHQNRAAVQQNQILCLVEQKSSVDHPEINDLVLDILPSATASRPNATTFPNELTGIGSSCNFFGKIIQVGFLGLGRPGEYLPRINYEHEW